MRKEKSTAARRTRRNRYHIRKRGGDRPRLSVFRSGQNIYAQVIRDDENNTVAAASTLDKELRGKLKTGANMDAAKAVGELIAKRAQDAGVSEVVFDRGGYLYHGRVRALAEAAREGGLKF